MISFQNFPLKQDQHLIVNWLNKVVSQEGYKVKKMLYHFVDDQEILRINQSHLNHDHYTDIITFDYTEGIALTGEMLISIETVQSNSEKLRLRFEEELFRVMTHGLLHLMGYQDKTGREAAIMIEKEDFYLNLRSKELKYS